MISAGKKFFLLLFIVFGVVAILIYFHGGLFGEGGNSKGVSDQELVKALKELRSIVPSPLPQGVWGGDIPEQYWNGFVHDSTLHAMKVVDQVLPRQYYFLLEYASDESYCYSNLTSTWNNVSVGEHIEDIFKKKFRNPKSFNNGKFIQPIAKYSFLSMITANDSDWTKKRFSDASEQEADRIYRAWVENTAKEQEEKR